MATRTTGTGTAEQAPAAAGNGAAGANEFEVINPADGSVIASLPAQNADQVKETVARVRAAQPEWEAMGFRGRYHWLGELRDWLIENHDQVADTMQAETGKTRADAAGEAPYLADIINYYGENGARFLADEEIRPHSPMLKTKQLKVVYRPQPVVGIISPWNFPLMLSLGDGIPALVAGSAVVIKPSEFTPLGLIEVVKAWKEEIGGPDILDVVLGMGETGSALVDEVDFIQFTGSEPTGKKVMARAAESLTPVSLELGGKDPMIVLRDADVERAANAATWGGFMNSGQICMSVERIYVEEPAYDDFVGRLKSNTEKLRQGTDGRSYSSEVGAMTSPNQTAIVEDHVSDAISQGAKALTGAKRREGPGDYYEPTILVDVDHSMKVMRDETFGPVIGVMKVRDEDEAVRLANDTKYGLSGSVFGEKAHAESIARRIECGACNVNDVLINYLTSDVPMGGWKSSGIGYRHGVYGIRKFCRSESLVISRLAGKKEAVWFPNSPRKGKMLRRLMRFFNARGLRNRLGLGRKA